MLVQRGGPCQLFGPGPSCTIRSEVDTSVRSMPVIYHIVFGVHVTKRSSKLDQVGLTCGCLIWLTTFAQVLFDSKCLKLFVKKNSNIVENYFIPIFLHVSNDKREKKKIYIRSIQKMLIWPFWFLTFYLKRIWRSQGKVWEAFKIPREIITEKTYY